MRSERGWLLLGVTLAVPTATACAGLIGLDDLRKGECPGAICYDDGGVQLDGSSPDVDAGPDAKVEAGQGADPVSWARWKMPNYRGADAGGDGGLPNPPLFEVAGDVVTDKVTDLVWRTSVLAGDLSREAAETACGALSPGKWRLPKRIELVTLLDYSASDIFIDDAVFAGVANVAAWTSSEVRPFTGTAQQAYWVVDFGTGEVRALRGNLVAKALCVKGGT